MADASKSTTFSIASNNSLVVSGSINESSVTGQQITLSGGGTLELDGTDGYTGGTIVTSGTLNVGSNGPGTLGAGPLNISGSSSVVNIGADVASHGLSIGSLSGIGAGRLNVANSTTLTVDQNTVSTFTGTLSLGTSSGLVIAGPGNGALTIGSRPDL